MNHIRYENMSPTRPQTIAVVVIAAVLMGAGVFAGVMIMSNPPSPAENSIILTILDNAGVMIEADGMRIYVDPINLPASYSTLPADAILITHPHGDHYNSTCINMLQKTSTVNIFPDNMSTEVATHDGVGVDPLDSVQVGTINITAFYMYTQVGEFASHHPDANWTSYIIDINGFKIFHAGDSKNITEYEMITGQMDVVLLPLGPGCQSMTGLEVVDAIDKLQPGYFIPIHTTNLDAELFVSAYTDEIAACSDCAPMWLEHWESHTFEP
jgi:L-ascorbate metabolism protein UlaG (beta-lactamase superfamily)